MEETQRSRSCVRYRDMVECLPPQQPQREGLAQRGRNSTRWLVRALLRPGRAHSSIVGTSSCLFCQQLLNLSHDFRNPLLLL